MFCKNELFHTLNSHYDKIFLITLKISADRHSLVQKTLKGLDYEIFWGVNGAEQDINELEGAGIVDRSGKTPPLTEGEIGCALSHLGVYRKIISENLDNALILEDDLILEDNNPGLVESLSQAMDELPKNWELLYLGYANNNSKMTYPAHLRAWFAYPLLSLINYKRFNPGKYRRRFPRNYSKNLQKAGYHYRTHSYAVSNSGARKILRFQTPISLAADNAISEMCVRNKINAFRLKNRIFYQNRSLKSLINIPVRSYERSPQI